MRITVYGLGYVGSVTAACLAREGHQVVGVDVHPGKVAAVSTGQTPIVEPRLEDILREAHGAGRLTATTEGDDAARAADVAIVCVGTPSKSNGDLDLSQVEGVARRLGAAIGRGIGPSVVLFRSTMLPGSVEERLIPILDEASGLRAGSDFGVAVCPEFLREGSGVADFYHPPFTVVGTAWDETASVIAEVFDFLDSPLHVVDIRTAEGLKYACNAFHAVKVTFANEVGRFMQASGGDARALMEIFCQDDRLNLSSYYLRPGFAFGGSCLPKDLRAAVYHARARDVEIPLLSSVLPSNEHHVRRAVDWILQRDVRLAALLGLSFKSGTDDLRESPYVELAEGLIGKGVDLRIYDPHVNPLRLTGTNRAYVEHRLPHLHRILERQPRSALTGVDCAIVASADQEFVRGLLADPPPLVLDLSGRLGAEVEALPGYTGFAW